MRQGRPLGGTSEWGPAIVTGPAAGIYEIPEPVIRLVKSSQVKPWDGANVTHSRSEHQSSQVKSSQVKSWGYALA